MDNGLWQPVSVRRPPECDNMSIKESILSNMWEIAAIVDSFGAQEPLWQGRFVRIRKDGQPVVLIAVSPPDITTARQSNRTDLLRRFLVVIRAAHASSQPFKPAGQGRLDDT